jgi:uncharacterized protein (TIGR02246 family)
MARLLVAGVGIALLAITLTASAYQASKPADTGNPENEAVQKVFQNYIVAFNKNDAKAVADFWTKDSIYVNRENGQRTEGRENILADMQKLFKEHPKVQLSIDSNKIRFIKPDVASAEGQVTVIYPDDDPSTTIFTTLLVKNDSSWLIDSAEEINAPTPATSSDALKDLEWLVGQWHDDTEGIDVEAAVRWSSKRAFLVRSYKVKVGDDEPYEGTQVIGWDPRKKQIRSWSFDSDGSFDDGAWSKNGDEWLIRSARTQADGTSASGTQVLKKVDADTFTIQTIARDVDGEPQPASKPVKVVRAKAAEEK